LLVVINEVAWAGTKSDPYAEWIELYNQANTPVNLDGWVLNIVGDPLPIRLTGTIPAGTNRIGLATGSGYFLLAREGHNPFTGPTGFVPVKTPTATPSVINQYFLDELSNDGAILELIAPDGSVVDRANSNNIVNGKVGLWPAGNASTPCSMARIDPNMVDGPSAWMTSSNLFPYNNGLDYKQQIICGSPGKINVGGATSTPAITLTRTMTPARTPTSRFTAVRTPTPNLSRPTPSSIVINEFLTQPRKDWNGDGRVDTGDEYIEIINLSSLPISISGWRLDDRDGDSNPYTIGNITMEPGVRLAFFASQTGILLSNGGDSVRLYKASGAISDAFTYGLVEVADSTWCRLPDGGNTWVFGCVPTVAETNRLGGSPLIGNRFESSICLSKTIPPGVLLAECNPLGLSIWNQNLWDFFSQIFPRFFEIDKNLYILE
jgi:hypothetical protein